MSYYIVVLDDESSFCFPMTYADDCEGAIECGSGSVALFPSPAAARKAIAISKRWALLLKEQGKPHNVDFTQGIKFIKVRKATMKEASK